MKKNNCGILLTNIGSPDSPNPHNVRRYLKEFLSDPRVVEIPRWLWLPILHGLVLPLRAKKSAALYQKIWTSAGSPLVIYSQKLAAELEKNLNIPVVVGMHYGKPSIATALEELKHKNVENIFILPLYPQYSATTTAATFDHVALALKKWRELPNLQFCQHYATHPAYVEAIVKSIQSFWAEHGRCEHLLFSFHGIPEKLVNAGDPYAALCQATVQKVITQLNLQPHEYSLSFQSRLGYAKWLGPYTDATLKRLPAQDIKHLQVICPGFAVDCLETLEEIVLRGHEQFIQAGGKTFQYIPALNATDNHIEVLKQIYINS